MIYGPVVICDWCHMCHISLCRCGARLLFLVWVENGKISFLKCCTCLWVHLPLGDKTRLPLPCPFKTEVTMERVRGSTQTTQMKAVLIQSRITIFVSHLLLIKQPCASLTQIRVRMENIAEIVTLPCTSTFHWNGQNMWGIKFVFKINEISAKRVQSAFVLCFAVS